MSGFTGGRLREVERRLVELHETPGEPLDLGVGPIGRHRTVHAREPRQVQQRLELERARRDVLGGVPAHESGYVSIGRHHDRRRSMPAPAPVRGDPIHPLAPFATTRDRTSLTG